MSETALPSEDISFDTNETNVLALPAGIVSDGYSLNDVPTSSNFNWFFNALSKWIKWAEARLLATVGLKADTTLTIASGSVTPTQGNHQVDTEGAAATDDLTNIVTTGLDDGRLLIVRSVSAARVVTVKNAAGGAGQVNLIDGGDFVLDSASKMLLLKRVGADWYEVSRTGSSSQDQVCQGRLTLASGVPITTTDQTAKTTVYFTPFKGNRISLYNGSSWVGWPFSEVSIAVPASTSTVYDVFAYLDASNALTLEAVAWTNDTTRATALALQNGIYVKSGSLTKRYLGSFRTTGSSGQTEDSKANRFLWNYYNRVKRDLYVNDTASSWTYSTATIRQANGNASNQVNVVIGVSEDLVHAHVSMMASGSGASVKGAVGVGIDSTIVNSATLGGGQLGGSSYQGPQDAIYEGYPGVGKHSIVWLESGGGAATLTWTPADNTGMTAAGGPTGLWASLLG